MGCPRNRRASLEPAALLLELSLPPEGPDPRERRDTDPAQGAAGPQELQEARELRELREPQEPQDALDRPSLQAALALLLPAAGCAGLFYLWLGDAASALVYGGMLGGGVAAITVEFVKYARSLREHPGEGGTPLAKALTLARDAFRIGFMKTFGEIVREILKLAGLKFLVTIVIAAIAFFVARAGHWF